MRFTTSKGSKVSKDAESFKGFEWLVRRDFDAGDQADVYHESRCGKCGRALTTPESVSSGIGPVCAEGMGLASSSSFNPKTFILAGNAIFTVKSAKTGKHFTYKVSRAKGNKDSRPWFVSVLRGPNNGSDYSYIGCLWN